MLYLSCNEDELSLWFGDLWAGDMHLKSYKCYSVLFDRACVICIAMYRL